MIQSLDTFEPSDHLITTISQLMSFTLFKRHGRRVSHSRIDSNLDLGLSLGCVYVQIGGEGQNSNGNGEDPDDCRILKKRT
jgi:hypothetical protein